MTTAIDVWILAGLVILPLAGACMVYALPRLNPGLGLITVVALACLSALLVIRVAIVGPYRHAVGSWGAPLGIDLHADGLSAVMIGMTGVVGLIISIYAVAYLRHTPRRAQEFFWPLWLFLWGSLNALFLSGDIFNMYVALELIGLGAVALAALGGSREALVAAIRYLLIALAASLIYLLGVALTYSRHGTVDWLLLSDITGSDPVTRIALALLMGGLLVKSAIWPLHVWLPPAHANAPAPVSAALSALVVKAGIYIMLRLWFWAFAGVTTVELGTVLAVLGTAAILWGSLMALRQARLKLLVAYSTVAQLGYIMLAFALTVGPPASRLAWEGGVYFIVAHACAKAAMFLAAGTILYSVGHDRIRDLAGIGQRLPMTFFAFALGGVSIMGLPPSGGFVAKWLLLNAALTSGQWWWMVVLVVGGLLSAAYLFRFGNRAMLRPKADLRTKPVPRLMEYSALALACLALLLGIFADQTLDLIDRVRPVTITLWEIAR